jgi:tetrahydromethanopterin S-methyltransferase subunit G
MKASVLYGLVSGLLVTAFIVGIYLNEPLNLLTGVEKFSWIFIFIGMLIGTWRERSMRTEPFINFQEALKTAFQIFVMAYLIKFLVIYIIFNYAHPALLDSARDIAVKIFIEHRNQEIPQEIFDQQLESYRKGYFGPRIFDIGVMLEIIIGFGIALVTAILFIREKPDF